MLTNTKFPIGRNEMNPPRKKRAAEIINDHRQRHSPLSDGFVLFAHNIRSLHNVGAFFRSVDGFGVHSLILSGYTPCPPSPAISKTALGAESWVTWRHTDNPVETLSELRRNGYLLCGLEQTDQSLLLHEYTPPHGKICLVLGNEVTGLSEKLIPLMDTLVEIPQFGHKHSLNVSVAAGVALYGFLVKLS